MKKWVLMDEWLFQIFASKQERGRLKVRASNVLAKDQAFAGVVARLIEAQLGRQGRRARHS